MTAYKGFEITKRNREVKGYFASLQVNLAGEPRTLMIYLSRQNTLKKARKWIDDFWFGIWRAGKDFMLLNTNMREKAE